MSTILPSLTSLQMCLLLFLRQPKFCLDPRPDLLALGQGRPIGKSPPSIENVQNATSLQAPFFLYSLTFLTLRGRQSHAEFLWDSLNNPDTIKEDAARILVKKSCKEMRQRGGMREREGGRKRERFHGHIHAAFYMIGGNGLLFPSSKTFFFLTFQPCFLQTWDHLWVSGPAIIQT